MSRIDKDNLFDMKEIRIEMRIPMNPWHYSKNPNGNRTKLYVIGSEEWKDDQESLIYGNEYSNIYNFHATFEQFGFDKPSPIEKNVKFIDTMFFDVDVHDKNIKEKDKYAKLDSIKNILTSKELKSTIPYYQLNSSGNGYHLHIKLPRNIIDKDEYERYYKITSDMFLKFGIEVDYACKNINRSYRVVNSWNVKNCDTELDSHKRIRCVQIDKNNASEKDVQTFYKYLDEKNDELKQAKVKVLKNLKIKKQIHNKEESKTIITSILNAIIDNYDKVLEMNTYTNLDIWLKSSSAIFDELGEDGMEYWHDFSSKIPDYDEACIYKTWNYYTSKYEISVGFLFNLLKNAGISIPDDVKEIKGNEIDLNIIRYIDSEKEILSKPLCYCEYYDNKELKNVFRSLNREIGESYQQAEMAARFINDIFKNAPKNIIALKPGTGKTTWMYSEILKFNNDIIDRDYKKLVVVCETLKTCTEHIENLRKCDSTIVNNIGFYHSFWSLECEKYRTYENITFSKILSNPQICIKCMHNKQCLGNYVNRPNQLKYDIIFMSHESLVRCIEDNLFPKDEKIAFIIDEDINVLHNSKISLYQIESSENKLIEIKSILIKDNYVNAIDSIDILLDDIKNIKSIMLDKNKHNASLNSLKHNLIINFNKENILNIINNVNIPFDLDILKNFILTLNYSIRTDSYFYINDYNNELVMSIRRSRIDIANLHHKFIILNGSGDLSKSPKEDIPITVCPDLERSYSNLTLVAIHKPNTQSFLSKKENIREICKIASENLNTNEEVFVSINKGKAPIMCSVLSEFNIRTSKYGIGFVGNIIGSNIWRQCRNGLNLASTFTSLEDYALKASCMYDVELNFDDLFTINKDNYHVPNITKSNNFINIMMDSIFIKESIYTLHQYILRMSQRENNININKYITCIPNIDIMMGLIKQMPGIRIKSDYNMFNLLDIISIKKYEINPSDLERIFKKKWSKIHTTTKEEIIKILKYYNYSEKLMGYKNSETYFILNEKNDDDFPIIEDIF